MSFRTTFFASTAFISLIAAPVIAQTAAPRSTPAINVTVAKVSGGNLVISGSTTAGTKVLLKYTNHFDTTGSDGKFDFAVNDYRPADCIVVISTPTAEKQLLLSDCAAGLNTRGNWLSTEWYKADDLVLYNGTTWRALTFSKDQRPDLYPALWQIFAQKGTQGIAGPPGPVGPRGAAGAAGPQGPAGTNGGPGAAGPAGPAGPTGAKGANGTAGATGPMGPAGPSGPRGLTGVAGPAGPAGAKGANGVAGPVGPAGPRGLAGVAGPAGPVGPAGAKGANGVAGPAGPTGAAGARGPAGLTGPAGATGPAGPAGPTGATGSQGPRGFAGADGTNGAPGAPGLDGAEGPQGPQGPTGPQGPQGPGLRMNAAGILMTDCTKLDDNTTMTVSRLNANTCRVALAPGSLGTFPLFFVECANVVAYATNGDGSGFIDLVVGPCGGPNGASGPYAHVMTMEHGPRPALPDVRLKVPATAQRRSK